MNQPNPFDRAAAVRPGEELDARALAGYLQVQFPGMDTSSLQILQYPSGHSNLTYLLRVEGRELVLRRPPFGAKIKSAHDMGREYHILSGLVPVYPRVPRPLAICEDETILGAPFYLMEKLEGVILRGARPAGMKLSAALMHTLSENFVDNLLAIHQVDYQAAGLESLGHPAGYVSRQIEGWSRRYGNARTDDIPEMERTASWLAEHLPPESGAALIHNDYKYDNLILDGEDPTRIIGVLDWEMATIGDPLMDLGTSLGYWVEAGDPPEMQALSFGLTALPGNLRRNELVERYARKSGQDLAHIGFYYVYGLFKIAVIIQQIYARYRAGYTQDERFANLIFGVRAISRNAIQAIEKGRIDRL